MARHPETEAHRQPNTLLKSAREGRSSPHHHRQPMSRSELADAVNTALSTLYPDRQNLASFYVDCRWVGKLERGEHHWASTERRAALRHVTGAATDRELGLHKPRSPERLARIDTATKAPRAGDGLFDSTRPGSDPGNARPIRALPHRGATDVADEHALVQQAGQADDPWLLAPRMPKQTAQSVGFAGSLGGRIRIAAEGMVRQRVDQAIRHGGVAPGVLDDWEFTIDAHARATRDRPATEVIAVFLSDMEDLQSLLAQRHTAHSLRRTTVLTARLAGLISLTLLKLNAAEASRLWGRTARVAAADADDPSTCSWVWAQEAYRYFYAGNISEAIRAAKYAQAVAGRSGGVGAVLAMALEARSHATIGHATATTTALHRAEDALVGLSSRELAASAFGYNEAQLRFHAGNAYTYLGNIAAASAAQQRALQLYSADDYLDRALIGLDHAVCLITVGDVREGAQQVTEVMARLRPGQCDGLLIARAHRVVADIPVVKRSLAAVREATEILAVCANPDKELSRDRNPPPAQR